MPVTRLLVEGELDAQLLAPLFAGNPVVEAIKSSKNALAPRTRTERQKAGPCVSYLRDRDFDYDPLDQLDQPTIDKAENGIVLGWRWSRHSIENYMLEPAIACTALAVDEATYQTALSIAGSKIKYYQAARWAIGIARSALPPYYELRTQPDGANEFYLPGDDGLTDDTAKNWALDHVEAFANRVRPKLEANAIAESYDKYSGFFNHEESVPVETILVYFSGKDLMTALDPFWRPLGILGANDFRGRIRDWMRAHPDEVRVALPEWQALLDTVRG